MTNDRRHPLRSQPLVVRLATLALLLGIGAAGAQPPSPDPDAPGALPPTLTAPSALGAPPLCEASAALVAPWDPETILVADNEDKDHLFAFSLGDTALEGQRELEMPAGDKPRDIEALARVGEAVLLVGSHSRNSACEVKEKRRRMRLVKPGDGGELQPVGFFEAEERWAEAMESGDACLEMLFTRPAPPGAREVCAALVAAEEAAATPVPAGEPPPCTVANIEGAFSTPQGRVWVGLRAPLAGSRAILLRLVDDLDELKLDAVTLLDLEGRGVRELAFDGETVWGIGGPPVDAADPFALFRLPLAAVRGEAVSPVIVRRDLPTSSEGMVILGRRALVVVDGDEPPAEGDPCAVPSRQYFVPLD